MNDQQEKRVMQQFNLGDLLHFIQIALLLVSLGVGYAKITQQVEQVGIHTQQLNRIEHYLSSKDSKYWDESRKSQ